MFQSTHPHGVRRLLTMTNSILICFNPRTHMGCDVSMAAIFLGIYCFNPRTHMGCDTSSGRGNDQLGKFQSTHPHGVRRL